jgi:hypothetical protein
MSLVIKKKYVGKEGSNCIQELYNILHITCYFKNSHGCCLNPRTSLAVRASKVENNLKITSTGSIISTKHYTMTIYKGVDL